MVVGQEHHMAASRRSVCASDSACRGAQNRQRQLPQPEGGCSQPPPAFSLQLPSSKPCPLHSSHDCSQRRANLQAHLLRVAAHDGQAQPRALRQLIQGRLRLADHALQCLPPRLLSCIERVGEAGQARTGRQTQAYTGPYAAWAAAVDRGAVPSVLASCMPGTFHDPQQCSVQLPST